MVDRGKCKFTTKANIAEAAGASAVLIINNQKGNDILLNVFDAHILAWVAEKGAELNLFSIFLLPCDVP